MKTVNSRLFYPIVAGLIAVGSITVYQLSHSRTLGADAAYAAADMQAFHPAPEFALKDVTGKTIKLSDYKGKVVVLNFWATWCPPCQKEIPDFNELQAKYASQGVQFLGIALDDEGVSKVKAFMATHPISYPIMLPDANVVKNYGEMSAIPVTFIIDRQGNILTSYVGMRQKSVLEGTINSYIASRPAPSQSRAAK